MMRLGIGRSEGGHQGPSFYSKGLVRRLVDRTRRFTISSAAFLHAAIMDDDDEMTGSESGSDSRRSSLESQQTSLMFRRKNRGASASTTSGSEYNAYDGESEFRGFSTAEDDGGDDGDDEQTILIKPIRRRAPVVVSDSEDDDSDDSDANTNTTLQRRQRRRMANPSSIGSSSNEDDIPALTASEMPEFRASPTRSLSPWGMSDDGGRSDDSADSGRLRMDRFIPSPPRWGSLKYQDVYEAGLYSRSASVSTRGSLGGTTAAEDESSEDENYEDDNGSEGDVLKYRTGSIEERFDTDEEQGSETEVEAGNLTEGENDDEGGVEDRTELLLGHKEIDSEVGTAVTDEFQREGSRSPSIHSQHDIQIQVDEASSVTTDVDSEKVVSGEDYILPPSPATRPHRSVSPLFPVTNTDQSGSFGELETASAPQLPMHRISQAPRRSAPIKGRRRGKDKIGFTRDYVNLLNAEIRLAAQRDIYSADNSFRIRYGSFVIGSWWTPEEKEVFFNHLAVLGRDGIETIAKAVGTKSVIECQAYIQELQEGSKKTEEFVRSRGRDVIGFADIPAAIEVPDDCIEALDKQAEGLEQWKEKNEVIKEKKEWGDSWLMDSAMAEKVDDLYSIEDIDTIASIAPEAELLDVKKMLELSRIVFMNGSDENNYRSLTPNEDLPSIRYTALKELHAIVTNLTRRLVATTLFTSQSRIRATDTSVFHPQQVVRPGDVRTALKTLDMPLNKLDYWARIPRRNNMGVLQHKLELNYREPQCMNYEAVEAALRKVDQKYIKQFFGDDRELLGTAQAQEHEAAKRLEDRSNSSSEAQTNDHKDDDFSDEEDDLKSEDSASSISTATTSSYLSDVASEDSHVGVIPHLPRHAAQRRRQERDQLLADTEDIYLDRLDGAASRKATKGLWSAMSPSISSCSSSSSSTSTSSASDNEEEEDEEEEDIPDPPRMSIRQIKWRRAVLDWRDTIEYTPEWTTWPQAHPFPHVAAGVPSNKRKMSPEISEPSEPKTKTNPTKRQKLDSNTKHTSNDTAKSRAKQPPKKKQKKAAVVKRPSPPRVVIRSPQKKRTRRQSSQYAGYVSTVDAVADSEGGQEGEPGEFEKPWVEFSDTDEGGDAYEGD